MTRCEVTLWLLGIGLISAFAMLRAVASAQRLAGVAQFQEQQQPTQSASAIMNSGELPGSASAASVAVTTPHFGVLAILRIARINLEVPVKQGTDHRSLSGGAGSIEGTAKPGSAGNIGIAAH